MPFRATRRVRGAEVAHGSRARDLALWTIALALAVLAGVQLVGLRASAVGIERADDGSYFLLWSDGGVGAFGVADETGRYRVRRFMRMRQVGPWESEGLR